MTWRVTAKPQQFNEAIAWFRKRVPISDSEFQALENTAKRKAFTVAGVAQLDLVNDVWKALDDAIANGTTLEQFKSDIGTKLATAWGGSNPRRLETIFRTNVQQAYSAGRYAQINDPDILETRPYWQYDSILDSRTSSLCKSLNGTILPYDHEFWKSHIPPLHFRCRSGLRSLTLEQAQTQGITENPSNEIASEGFGLPPEQSEWQPNQEQYAPNLIRGLIGKIDELVKPIPRNAILKPNGIAVSDTLNRRYQQSDRKQVTGIDAGIEAVDQVLGDGALHKIDVRFGLLKDEGGHSWRSGSGTIEILIDQNTKIPAITVVHEIAHRLDVDALGNRKAYGSERINYLVQEVQAISGWHTAIYQSNAYASLKMAQTKRKKDQQYQEDLRILLRPRELFARSFAQYIAVRSQNPQMLSELTVLLDAKNFLPNAFLQYQWEANDFEAIAKSFDKMLYNLGWVVSQ